MKHGWKRERRYNGVTPFNHRTFFLSGRLVACLWDRHPSTKLKMHSVRHLHTASFFTANASCRNAPDLSNRGVTNRDPSRAPCSTFSAVLPHPQQCQLPRARSSDESETNTRRIISAKDVFVRPQRGNGVLGEPSKRTERSMPTKAEATQTTGAERPLRFHNVQSLLFNAASGK